MKWFFAQHHPYLSRLSTQPSSAQVNGDPSSARWLYWSRMKGSSICIEKNKCLKNKNNLAFHPWPVQPPSGEGSPLLQANYNDAPPFKDEYETYKARVIACRGDQLRRAAFSASREEARLSCGSPSSHGRGWWGNWLGRDQPPETLLGQKTDSPCPRRFSGRGGQRIQL